MVRDTCHRGNVLPRSSWSRHPSRPIVPLEFREEISASCERLRSRRSRHSRLKRLECRVGTITNVVNERKVNALSLALISPPGMRLICDASSGSRLEISRSLERTRRERNLPEEGAPPPRTIKGTPGSLAEEPIW